MTDRDDPTPDTENDSDARTGPNGSGKAGRNRERKQAERRAKRRFGPTGDGSRQPELRFHADRKPVAPPEPSLNRPGRNGAVDPEESHGTDDAQDAHETADPDGTQADAGADGMTTDDQAAESARTDGATNGSATDGAARGSDAEPQPQSPEESPADPDRDDASTASDTAEAATADAGSNPQARGDIVPVEEAPTPARRGRRRNRDDLVDRLENKKQIKIVEVAKPAGPARTKRRHWGVVLAFVLIFVVPFSIAAWYLFERAADQYASTVGFTVRTAEGPTVAGGLAGLPDILGGGSSADADIIYEFLQSRSIVERVKERIDFEAKYAAYHEQDPFFALEPGADLETLASYWNRILSISYEQANGLMEIRVLAFDPATAKEVADAIVEESTVLINALNSAARQDAVRFAQRELDEAVERRKQASQAILDFQIRNQMVNPERDIEMQLGVLNTYNQQLANAQVELDLLLETTSLQDPRVLQAQNRIEVIQELIDTERQRLADANGRQSGGPDYPALIAEFGSLQVDQEYAERVYSAALTALDRARIDVTRQSRYLAVYIPPVEATSAEYPRRGLLLSLIGLFLFLAWTILVLIYYSIRDGR